MDAIYRCYTADLAWRRSGAMDCVMRPPGATDYADWLKNTHSMTEVWRGWYVLKCTQTYENVHICTFTYTPRYAQVLLRHGGVPGEVVNSNTVESHRAWLKNSDFIDTDRVSISTPRSLYPR